MFLSTCAFLYVSLFILGLGVGSTYALGVSFLCGATKNTAGHGAAMHRLGSLVRTMCCKTANTALTDLPLRQSRSSSPILSDS